MYTCYIIHVMGPEFHEKSTRPKTPINKQTIDVCVHVIVCVTCVVFFLYTATHEQVTSAPSRKPSDSQNHTLTPEQNKIAMSRHSLLRKEINLGKQMKYGFSELVYYNRGTK